MNIRISIFFILMSLIIFSCQILIKDQDEVRKVGHDILDEVLDDNFKSNSDNQLHN
jgi:hypothetical protein